MTMDYDISIARELHRSDVPFYALIYAAMLKADGPNLAVLRAGFPEQHKALRDDYETPAGILLIQRVHNAANCDPQCYCAELGGSLCAYCETAP